MRYLYGLLISILFIGFCYADPVTLPYDVITDPTNKGDRKSITINFDDNTAIAYYELWNYDRTILLESFSFALNTSELIALFGGSTNANLFKSNLSTAMSQDLQSKRTTQ